MTAGWRSRRRLATVAVALTVAGCATVAAPSAPDMAAEAPATVVDDPPSPGPPSGLVRVAYPDPVVTWWQQDEEDLAAGDLAALWALPLYRLDELGRLRPGLATDARVDASGGGAAGGWAVEVDLAPGSWSDGTPVTAADVVATTSALRTARPAAWAAFVEAVAVDDDTVRLVFDRPFAGWPWLLSGAPGVLPAHRLAELGLEGWGDELDVTGGMFRVTEHTPELRTVFAAHADGPLGAPGLATVEVLVVPDHDVALGLLDRDEVDVVLGHVALDAGPRAAEVEGATSVVAFGGTRVELLLDPDRAGSRSARRAALAALDPAAPVEGLLREAGRLPGGLVPALPAGSLPAPEASVGAELALQVAVTVEGVGLLARLLQSELTLDGIEAELVRVEPPQTVTRPVTTDGRLRVVRVAPGRSLGGLLADLGVDAAVGTAADAAGVAGLDPMVRASRMPAALAEATELVAGEAVLRPLAELGVAHVWRATDVTGITPSGWPGLAFWDVGAWRVPAA